jgi:integrase/recombinase XerD
VYLTQERKLAPSSLVIAACALRFLYKVTLKHAWVWDAVIPAPKKPAILPEVLSPDEVVHFLACVPHPAHRTILTTCYATGLRISEAVRLTVSAIDSQRMVLRVEDGKGHQDRYVMLSPKLLAILREWWRVHRPPHWLFPGKDPARPLTSHAVRAPRHDHGVRDREPAGLAPAAAPRRRRAAAPRLPLSHGHGSPDAYGGGHLPPLRRGLPARS